MITQSAGGLTNIACLVILLIGIYSIIAYLFYRLWKFDKAVFVVFRIAVVSTVIFGFFAWYIAVVLWGVYAVAHIIYLKAGPKKNDGIVKRALPYQLSSFALVNLQMPLESIPCFETTCFSGALIPDYILNICCISGVMIIAYYLLRPLSLKGRPQYSGWRIDYTVCFVLSCALLHILFFCLYFFA